MSVQVITYIPFMFQEVREFMFKRMKDALIEAAGPVMLVLAIYMLALFTI
jgi:hypothetical protein